jgi:hypothetical protein
MDVAAKNKRVELGDEVRDTISGFTGVCSGMFRYINGCTRCMVEPRKLHDGKVIEAMTFDVSQLTVVKKAVVPVFAGAEQGPGGPRLNPPTRGTPSRSR